MRPDISEDFVSKGYVRLGGFHPQARVASIRRSIQEQLGNHRDDAGIPASVRKLPVFQQIAALSGRASVTGLHASLMTRELADIVAGLAGKKPRRVQDTQLLLSPPKQGSWTLQGLNWHVDIAADARAPIPGIQAFFLIDDVAPRGGATLALPGSHRPDVDIAALRRTLKTSECLEFDLQKAKIRIAEMSGRAGDVFLMDMRLLHTPAINESRRLRMMATTRCLMSDM